VEIIYNRKLGAVRQLFCKITPYSPVSPIDCSAVNCVHYSGKCSPPWETAVRRPHTRFTSQYLKPHQPRYWLTYMSTFYLYMFCLVSLSVSRTVGWQLHSELERSPGLTWDVKAKFVCRDWLKILKDCIGSIVCPWPWIWTGKCRNTKHGQTFPCLRNFRPMFLFKHDRQCAYKRKSVARSHNYCCYAKVRGYVFLACVCGLLATMQGACAVLYCHLGLSGLYRIFPHFLIKGTVFEKKLLNVKCVFWSSLLHLCETFVILRIRRDIIVNVPASSCQVPVILVQF